MAFLNSTPDPKISRRALAETILGCMKYASKPFVRKIVAEPKSIFILRNNGLGDLLCATPIFEILKRKYPTAEIIAGIGNWHENLLEGNPYISRCISINAPWHNQFVVAPNLLRILSYIFLSKESRNLAALKLDVGFDIVGSLWGSLLLLRCGIPFRVGVKGYAGGHAAASRYVTYDPNVHVSEACISMAKILGINNTPSLKPQIYLSDEEISSAELKWRNLSQSSRILIAPGGSFNEKCWGDKRFAKLVSLILEKTNHQVTIIGGIDDENRIPVSHFNRFKARITSYCGKLNLRQSAAMVCTSNFVICNSSVAMHFAGAYSKPNLVLLGSWYDSAIEHKIQWGHEKTTILGKEVSSGQNHVTPVTEAFKRLKHMLKHLNL